MAPFGVFNLYPPPRTPVFTLKMLFYPAFIDIYPFSFGYSGDLVQVRFPFFLRLFRTGKSFFLRVTLSFLNILSTACGQTLNFSANSLRNCTVPQIPVGMFFKQTGQFAFVYFSPAFFWSSVFKRTGFFKLFLPAIIPLGIDAEHFIHFLKCMSHVFIFNDASPKFFTVCHAL
jgi:hypothetical protein